MQASSIAKWLILSGGGVATAVLAGRALRRRRDRPLPAPFMEIDRIDPNDPVQGFDEATGFYIETLDVDAQAAADAEAAADLAALESELDEEPVTYEQPVPRLGDAGDLYGVHVPPAVDRQLLDDDRAFEQGENWLEHMQATFSENGPEPERPVDPDDDSDHNGHHSTDTRDTPVADRGSAGRRGL